MEMRLHNLTHFLQSQLPEKVMGGERGSGELERSRGQERRAETKLRSGEKHWNEATAKPL